MSMQLERRAGAVDTDAAAPATGQSAPKRPPWRRWAGGFWAQAGVCMVVAAILRVWFLIRAQGMFDGDEAVLGMQAEQILRGAHPTYVIGVEYLGTIEAYLAAPFVALLGPSAWALRIPPLVESLLLVPITGALAERLYGRRARLPALILAAVPALYVAVGELRFLGGYIETLLFGTLAMLLVVVIFDRLREGQRVLWQTAALGLVVGVGFWTYTLVLEYLVAIGVWALPLAIWRLRAAWAGRTLSVRGVGLGGLAGIGGLLVGYSPALLYGIRHDFSNFAWIAQMVLGGNPADNGVPPAASPVRLGALHYLLTRALPRLTGGYPLWPPTLLPGLLQFIGLAFLAAAVLYSLFRLAQHIPVPGRGAAVPVSFEQSWTLVLAPLLLLLVSLMYWRSSFSNGYVFNFDRTGRYMLPAGTAITLLLAYLFADLPTLCSRVMDAARARVQTSLLPLAPTGRASRAAKGAAWMLFGVLLVFNFVQYPMADAVQAMQTPYRQGDLFPVVDGNIVTYLEQHHIRYIWGNHWFDYVTMYLSDGQITAADYLGRERIPANTYALEHADHPTYVIEADPSKGECATARMLDQMHVTYTAVPFQHYWLITPLSRNVQPSEIEPTLPRQF